MGCVTLSEEVGLNETEFEEIKVVIGKTIAQAEIGKVVQDME